MFKLNIECSKDIDKLNIDFSDGSTTVIANGEENVKKSNRVSEKKKKTNKISERTDIPLNLDETFEVQDDIIEKPIIPDRERTVHVSEEIQNLEI